MNARLSSLLLTCTLALGSVARADDDPQTTRAREEFVKGTDSVHKAQWSEALAAFERSSKLRPHAITTYNVGACERALGQYTRARKTLREALAQNERSQGQELADGLVTEIKGYLDQIDGLLATADVTLDPASAALAVDGRPLELDGSTGALVAGLRAPGPGETPPTAAFKLIMDPGVHVITLSRKGYADALVNKTVAPGSSSMLVIALDKLPATFHIEADQPSAIVKFAGADVGAVPIDVSRPGGTYHVEVKRDGFVTYEATVVGQPGEAVNLRARMPPEKPSIVTRWWFWTVAAVVVGGAATATYFLVHTDPAPIRPALNGGALGWTVQTP